eukprot:1643618-Amphidinium_carterae.2
MQEAILLNVMHTQSLPVATWTLSCFPPVFQHRKGGLELGTVQAIEAMTVAAAGTEMPHRGIPSITTGWDCSSSTFRFSETNHIEALPLRTRLAHTLATHVALFGTAVNMKGLLGVSAIDSMLLVGARTTIH